MPTIETTAGPVESSELGRTLVHEHLIGAGETIRAQYPHLYDLEAEFAEALRQVTSAKAHGVRTIVDPTCMDLGRDVHFASRVAQESGLNIVMATGIYGQHYTFIPYHFENRDEDYLADAFVHDIEVGIQGTEVKAAFLKCAADEPGITPDVEKVHRAAARASLRTGRPIMAHSRPASRTGIDQMQIFLDEGVAPHKVQIAHTGDTDDLGYIEELLAMGPYIGLDRYGTAIFLPDERRNATVAALLERGYVERMMLSHDCVPVLDWFPAEMRPQLAPDWRMDLLFTDILPQLAQLGVTDEQVATMLDENPARWLVG